MRAMLTEDTATTFMDNAAVYYTVVQIQLDVTYETKTEVYERRKPAACESDQASEDHQSRSRNANHVQHEHHFAHNRQSLQSSIDFSWPIKVLQRHAWD